MEQQSDNRAISYHIFLLPFYCKDGRLDQQCGTRWKKDTLTDGSISSVKEERKLDYATAQYFTPEARRLLFNGDDSYVYQLPSAEEFYEIVKDGLKYRLLVKKITVTVFDKNIGVMALYTEFWKKHQDAGFLDFLNKEDKKASGEDKADKEVSGDENEKLHKENEKLLKAVKEINEYGRRINLPFLGTIEEEDPDTGQSTYSYFHPLVADSISLFGVKEDFRKMSVALYKGSSDYPLTGYIIKPLSELLNSLFPNEDIVPVIDDRMFVCCLADNTDLSNEIKEASPDAIIERSGKIEKDESQKEKDESQKDKDENQKEKDENKKVEYTDAIKNRLFTKADLSDAVYALSFIDADEASCGLEMRRSILRRCVYHRWQQVGTIDVITHHSFVRIVGNAPDYVIKPFITQYVYLAIGALMQRAEILWLSDRSAALSREYFQLRDASGKIDNKTISARLTELKRRYVYAQNNIFLNQLTVEEQGVEEFEMLKRELYIDDSLEKLDRSINSIYDFTSEFAESEENEMLNMLTKIGLPLAFMQLFTVILSFNLFREKSSWGQAGVLGVIISLCFFLGWMTIFLFNLYKKKKQPLKSIVIIGGIVVFALSLALLIFYLFK